MRPLLVLAIVLATAKPSDACTPVFDRAIVGAPAFEPADAVAITSEQVDVSCDEQFACTVTSTFGIAVAKPAHASVEGFRTVELALAASGRKAPAAPPSDPDKPITVALELEPKDTQMVLHARAVLPEFIDGCFTDGIIARHPFLASRPKGYQHVLEIATAARPRLDTPSSWSLDVDRNDATPLYSATTRFWFSVPTRYAVHGGPVVLIGGATGAGRGFRARVGWEVAVVRPWLVVGVMGDTDFAEAWSAALTAEPTNQAWVLPLTFGAGGGVVLANGGRFGGRGQISIALGAVRTMASVDVVTAADGSGVDTSVAGWIGGGF